MSLFLSRLQLDQSSRRVLSEVSHPYEMHRTLLRAFPPLLQGAEKKASESFGLLFRVDAGDPRNPVKVIVQSRAEPDWSFLEGIGDYLACPTEGNPYEHKDLAPTLQYIRNKQVLSFVLRANPTKRISKQDDPMRGKRVELCREEEQVAWLVRKGVASAEGQPGGFEIVSRATPGDENESRSNLCLETRTEGKQRDCKRESGHGFEMTHLSVLFQGLLRVVDREAFVETLARGIGSGKAFGFGLLSIAPARE